jgi:hypothetical protein
MLEAIDEAVSADPGNVDLQINAESMRVCLLNVREWADQIIDIETNILDVETEEDVQAIADEATEAVTLAEHITIGFDANQNGRVEPFENECGLDQLSEYGVEFGNLVLREGGLDAE